MWERVCALTYVEGLGSNVGEGMRTHLRRGFRKCGRVYAHSLT